MIYPCIVVTFVNEHSIREFCFAKLDNAQLNAFAVKYGGLECCVFRDGNNHDFSSKHRSFETSIA